MLTTALQAIKKDYDIRLANCYNDSVVKVGAPDLNYLAAKYHFTPYYLDYSVLDDEYAQGKLNEIYQIMSKDGLTNFLADDFLPAEISTSIISETGSAKVAFAPASNPTGTNYLDNLRQNLISLKTVLDCQ